MELKPRFNNRAVRRLFDEHQIDLMNLEGATLTDHAKRVTITKAGLPNEDGEGVVNACDDLTPGEHIELLTVAIMRDLIPESNRKEAAAKAATLDKSGEAKA